MAGSSSFRSFLVSGTAFATIALGIPTGAYAQVISSGEETQPANTPTGAALPVNGAETAGQERGEGEAVIITGSRIKRDPNNSPLPLQIITNEEVRRNGISSPEQLLMYLPTNGTGADNLASNSDVVTGAQRGTNGLSAANLRGQGSGGTLVLLNGRRVAAHGLSGSAVDVNQIPFAAIDRIEVLKDGASAIYGTDAVGGVINFITRTDYQGVGMQGFVDITDEGDSPIYRLSGIVGYGDIDTQNFNVMASLSKSWRGLLRGSDRAFVNANQPDRGLTVDTRGTPQATAFNIGANAFQMVGGTLLTGLTLTAPNGANAAAGGINPLDLPGGAGCESMDGGQPYDWQLWNAPTAFYACAWDTGRAAVLQQPIDTTTYFGRGVVRFAEDHLISVEVAGSDANSAKSFSNAQLSANTTNLPIGLPLNDLTRDTYNQVYNLIYNAFPLQAQRDALAARYGRPISGRYRCIPCGPREYVTDTETFRVAAGIEGPLFSGWDYRAGASYAKSESSSVLGSGYYYRGTLANGANDPNSPSAPGATAPGLVGLINSGILNIFSPTVSPQAIAGLAAISAEGETLYGGQYEVKQFDYSVSGPLFNIWGGPVQAAVGFDVRRETYSFNGSEAAAAAAPVIFLAAFDNVNALTPKSRNIHAAYAEVLFPIFDQFEFTAAVRADDYTGFGTTVNPKFSVRYRPWDPIMIRANYNTSFRVPTFNQIFNGVTLSPYAGSDLVDPERCPSLTFNNSDPNCVFIRPEIASGGNRELGPESAKQASVGIVVEPAPRFSASVDWWMINVDDTIQLLTLRELITNYDLFPDRFIRDSANNIIGIDQRWINAGARRTQGLEIALRGGIDAFGGTLSVGLDGTRLLKKKEKLTQDSPYGPSLLGVFSYAGDLGLKWKHNAFISYNNGPFSASLTQLYRDGYDNGALPGIANGTVTRPGYNETVDSYITYHASVSYQLQEGTRLTAGIRNIFDTDPPFAITYDGNSGAGGSWEPRVADPRGRSFTMSAEFKF